jgi:hypothetical protein
MPEVQLFQTVMGHRFYEGDMPGIRRNLEAINVALLDLTVAVNRLAFIEERQREDRIVRKEDT